MRVSDWNRILQYATEACEELKSCGYDARYKVYTMYDGRKGVYIHIYDAAGEVYTSYASGIHDTVEGYADSLKRAANSIKSKY